MSTPERKEWRRRFTQEIMALVNDEANILEVAILALDAQAEHGDRDPVEVARAVFAAGKVRLDD